MAYQKLIIQGNIGQIHEPRYTADGKAVVGFSVAYSEGRDKTTTWFNCTAFGRSGEFVQQYFQKGDGIIVEGRIQCEKYTDKNSGAERESWKVSVDKVAFSGGKKDSVDSAPEPRQSSPKQEAKPQGGDPFGDFDETIPFADPFHKHGKAWRAI